MPDGGSPLIYKGKQATVIVSGSEIDPDEYYSVSLDADETEEFQAVVQEIESKDEALKIAETLAKYVDDDIYNLPRLCKKFGMDIY